MSTVENREMRLGTIIGWDGKASQLIEESDYEGRSEKKQGHGCGGGKGGKRNGKFGNDFIDDDED